jgi:peptide/nickel transport system ATP-binding protein
MSQPILSIDGLKTAFHTFGGAVKAVDGVSCAVMEGEVLGVVGESGCGKSVLGFSIMGLVDLPGRVTDGRIMFNGSDLLEARERDLRRIRGREIAMIFQDPMTALDPLFTIRHQMEEGLKLHGNLTRTQRRLRCIELLEEVGIPHPESRINNYPHQFSGGMRQRVLIAIALASNPKLVIADEPTTALDVTIQSQILRLLKRLVSDHNMSLMLITHDLAVVSEMADRIMVMYCGRVVENGPTRQIIDHPAHPYTRGLLDSIPKMRERQRTLNQITGSVPDVMNLPTGCAFAPRCTYATETCNTVAPQLVAGSTEHQIACHNPLDIHHKGPVAQPS